MQWRRVVGPGNVALVVLGVVTVALLVLAIQKQSALSSAASPVPAAPTTAAPTPAASAPVPGQPSVAFIGDSFTSGTPDGGLGPANYTALLAAREGWSVTNAAIDGAGYVAVGAGGGTFATQVPRVVAARPGLVVVEGARPDLSVPPSDVRTAADNLYRYLRQQLPQARIVVVGPIWPGEDAPEQMLQVRDSLRDAAQAAQLPFIDPLDDEWFQAPDDPGLAPDRQHLNDTGHRGLADLVGTGVRQAGVSPG